MADGIVYIFDIFGTAIFAITGAVKGVRNRLDFLGVIVFALVLLRTRLEGGAKAQAAPGKEETAL